MNLTNGKETKKILEWANSVSCYNYEEKDLSTDSYFKEYGDSDVYELNFADIKELRQILAVRKKVVKDTSLDLVLAVTVFKHKPIVDVSQTVLSEERKKEVDEQNILPDFTYTF